MIWFYRSTKGKKTFHIFVFSKLNLRFMHKCIYIGVCVCVRVWKERSRFCASDISFGDVSSPNDSIHLPCRTNVEKFKHEVGEQKKITTTKMIKMLWKATSDVEPTKKLSFDAYAIVILYDGRVFTANPLRKKDSFVVWLLDFYVTRFVEEKKNETFYV